MWKWYIIQRYQYMEYTYLCCRCFTGVFLSCFDGLFCYGGSFLGRNFYNWKRTKLLQDKEVRRIKRRSGSKNLSFHTFIDFRFYVNIFYANMKVPFETVQVVLSRNHSVSLYLRFLSKDFYKVPTDEPVWKWKAKSRTKFSTWKSREFRRIHIKISLVLLLRFNVLR